MLFITNGFFSEYNIYTDGGKINITVHTDITAIRYNIGIIREKIGKTFLTAMVKADAYNHGMKTAVFIEDIVDGYGISSIEEGIYLRQLGIKKQIKVAGFCAEDAKAAAFYNLIPMVSDFDSLEAIIRLNQKIKIDIKLDSGMNRLGFNNSRDIEKLSEMILENKNIEINSIATHFSFCDFENMTVQAEIFENYCKIIEDKLGKMKKNASASGGLVYGERFLYDEVRIGLMLYGYMPSINENFGLRQAMLVTTSVIAVKNVKKGDRIGYSGLYIANKDDRIGIIKCGYYEGLTRLAKGSTVIINGQKASIIGNVCMDFAFILLDGIQAKSGDTVFLLSSDNDAEKLAARASTIPYEIITNFKGRMERVYYL